MSAQEVTLPWPPKELNPNQRLHWRKKNEFSQTYKTACWVACKAVRLAAPETEGKIHVWLDIFPPDARHRDEDNCLASLKHGLDGVAAAVGVNDRRFTLHTFFHEQIGGMVKVRLTAGPEVLT